MSGVSKIKMEEARLDPRAVFGEPMQVVASKSLTPEQKRDILEKWREDEIGLQRAEGEGMGDGENDMMRRVDGALHALHERTGIKTSLTD